MYSALLCAVAFVSFWQRLHIAGMILVVLAIIVVGLGFGHMMNSPCPLDGLPPDADLTPPPLPSELHPPLNLQTAVLENPIPEELLGKPATVVRGEPVEI